jgi:hypothetical protein
MKRRTGLERQANWQSKKSALFFRPNSALCLTLRSKAGDRKTPPENIGIALDQISRSRTWILRRLAGN